MRKSCTFVLGLSLLGFGLVGSAKADQIPGPQAAQIRSEIQMRFQKDTDLKNNHIETVVDNGVVVLKGTVDTNAEKAKAGRLAVVKGVVQVDNQLDVGSVGVKMTVTDASTTARLKTELMAEDPLRSVHVETNNAVVSLTGTVATETAHRRALELARTLEGVSRIDDGIRVRPATTP